MDMGGFCHPLICQPFFRLDLLRVDGAAAFGPTVAIRTGWPSPSGGGEEDEDDEHHDPNHQKSKPGFQS